MFLNALAPQTKKSLEKLDSSLFFSETKAYLAGGTALALHLNHRYSHDLDFFTQKDFEIDQVIQLLNQVGTFQLEQTSWKTILGGLEETKFSLFYYQYPLLSPLSRVLTKTQVASQEDLVAMKLAAIASRGTKRDFIDLYFLLDHFPLEKMLSLYDQKYQNLSVNRTHLLKSLIYFADAEEEPLPQMIQTLNWEEVKKFFREQVKNCSGKIGFT